MPVVLFRRYPGGLAKVPKIAAVVTAPDAHDRAALKAANRTRRVSNGAPVNEPFFHTPRLYWRNSRGRAAR